MLTPGQVLTLLLSRLTQTLSENLERIPARPTAADEYALGYATALWDVLDFLADLYPAWVGEHGLDVPLRDWVNAHRPPDA